MEIFERLGLDIRPIINAAGQLTMYGGATMPQEVVDAMSEVAHTAVRVDELQAAASKFIAKITGAEAGYVTCGCAAALMAASAACLTGYNVDSINRLPDTSGIPNEILMVASQRNVGYTPVLCAAGAKIVYVGMGQQTLVEDFEHAITNRTVAIFYYYGLDDGIPPLEEVVQLGKKCNIPIILDAANGVPPVENLRKFISMGVDLVAISGGKGIRGPQASGLLFGRRDLIAAASLNYFTPGFASGLVTYEQWAPPPSLVPKEKMRDVPNLPVGRGLKVSKEAVIGLLTALQIRTDEERNAKEMERLRSLLEPIVARCEGIPGLQIERGEFPARGFPTLEITVDTSKTGMSIDQLVQKMKGGEPPIYFLALQPQILKGKFIINSCNLNEEQVSIVADRLYAAFTGQ